MRSHLRNQSEIHTGYRPKTKMSSHISNEEIGLKFLSVYNLHVDKDIRKITLESTPREKLDGINSVREGASCLTPLVAASVVVSLAETVTLQRLALDKYAAYTDELLSNNESLQTRLDLYEGSEPTQRMLDCLERAERERQSAGELELI